MEINKLAISVSDASTEASLTLRGTQWGHQSDEPAIICLPGLTRNERDFADFGPWLAARGRRVIAISFRGRGNSDFDPDYLNYHPMQYAADVEAVMDTLEIDRAVFVGTSLGGIVTMLMARAAPQRIIGAVLNDIGPELAREGLERIGSYMAARNAHASKSIGPDGRFLPVSLADAVASIRAINEQAFPTRPESFWPAMVQRGYRETPDGWQLDYDPAIARALAEVGPAPDLWPAFRSLTSAAPVLVVRGALSDLLTPAIVDKMYEAAPDIKVTDVPGTGHAPMLDEPEARDAIEAFLCGLDIDVN